MLSGHQSITCATSQGCHVYPEQHDASRAAGQSFCSPVQGISGTRFFELWPARKKKAFFLYLLDFFRLDEESCIKSRSKDFSICLSFWYVAVRSNLPQKASEWGTECLWYLIKLGHSNRKHNLLSVFESASPIRYPEAQTPEQVPMALCQPKLCVTVVFTAFDVGNTRAFISTCKVHCSPERLILFLSDVLSLITRSCQWSEGKITAFQLSWVCKLKISREAPSHKK